MANWLHLNRGKKAWTYVADSYAAFLLFLAFSGLFMIPGRKGLIGRGAIIALLFFLMAHAVGTEYVQLRWSGRDGCLRDVLIDHAGILLGLILSWKRWTRPDT